jgi:hypothetical protein
MEYELSTYRREDLVLSKEQVERTEKKKISGYSHPEIAKDLPEQTLLLDKAGRKTQELWQ